MADEHEHAHHSTRPTPAQSSKSDFMTRDNLIFIALLLAIFVITIYTRLALISYTGFYEPDGFYHFAVIRAAVNNHFIVPKTLGISGYPGHTTVGEPDGLYWMTLFPYAILQFFGVSYYTVQRLIPLLFGLLDVIGAYYLSRLVSKDKAFNLLSAALVALSAGDAARTSALIYRGDGFVTPFLLGALLFMGWILSEKNRTRKLAYMLLSGLMLSICNLVWNGGSFAVAVYIFAFALIGIFAFIKGQRDLLVDTGYLLGSVTIWFLLVMGYVGAGFVQPGGLVTLLFLPMLLVMIVGWSIAAYLLTGQHPLINASGVVVSKLFKDRGFAIGTPRTTPYLSSPVGRFIFVIVLFLLGAFVVALAVPSLVNSIFVANGFTVNSSFAATIQELTSPTFGFLFASFNVAMFSTPMTIIMALSSVLPGYTLLFWIVLLVSFVPYFFMRVYDSGGWLNGRPRLVLDIKPEFFILIAFFAITAYLQMYAIRFNSLVAVPLAIFCAYTMYYIVLFLVKRITPGGTVYWITLLSAWAFSLLLLIPANGVGLPGFIAVPMAVVIALIIYSAVVWFSDSPQSQLRLLQIALICAVAVTLILILGYDLLYGGGITQADSINPQFLAAASWIKNNTSPSSVFLTLWPDGSVIEGWGNRTSVTDSVGSQNLSKADPFAQWILNSSDDPQFLTGPINGGPNYLLVRSVWLQESSGIYTESNLPANQSSNYGYAILGQVAEGANATTRAFRFAGGDGLTAYVYISNGSQVNAYLQEGQGISPFSWVTFYNQTNGAYQTIQQTRYNQTNGQMLVIIYSPVASPNGPVNVTGALLFAQGMAESNMLKFIFFCNTQTCTWDNKFATLTQVYANSDTKIFKINYNTSA